MKKQPLPAGIVGCHTIQQHCILAPQSDGAASWCTQPQRIIIKHYLV
jgi:hypothetical protein